MLCIKNNFINQFHNPGPKTNFKNNSSEVTKSFHLKFSELYSLNSFTGGTNQNDSIDSNMKKLCGELAWYVQALENHKSSANGVPKSVMASWELIAA